MRGDCLFVVSHLTGQTNCIISVTSQSIVILTLSQYQKIHCCHQSEMFYQPLLILISTDVKLHFFVAKIQIDTHPIDIRKQQWDLKYLLHWKDWLEQVSSIQDDALWYCLESSFIIKAERSTGDWSNGWWWPLLWLVDSDAVGCLMTRGQSTKVAVGPSGE